MHVEIVIAFIVGMAVGAVLNLVMTAMIGLHRCAECERKAAQHGDR